MTSIFGLPPISIEFNSVSWRSRRATGLATGPTAGRALTRRTNEAFRPPE